MGKRCASCNPTEMPTIPELARTVATSIGSDPETWWRPLLSWVEFQAEAVSFLRLSLRCCPHHASYLGAVVTNHLRLVCAIEGTPTGAQLGG